MTLPQAWALSQKWYGDRLDPDFRRRFDRIVLVARLIPAERLRSRRLVPVAGLRFARREVGLRFALLTLPAATRGSSVL